MTEEKSSRPKEGRNRGSAIGLVASLLLMIACMVASYYYPDPSGKHPDFLSLLAFWGREALIVAAALVFLVVFAVSAVIKFFRSLRGPGTSRKR